MAQSGTTSLFPTSNKAKLSKRLIFLQRVHREIELEHSAAVN